MRRLTSSSRRSSWSRRPPRGAARRACAISPSTPSRSDPAPRRTSNSPSVNIRTSTRRDGMVVGRPAAVGDDAERQARGRRRGARPTVSPMSSGAGCPASRYPTGRRSGSTVTSHTVTNRSSLRSTSRSRSSIGSTSASSTPASTSVRHAMRMLTPSAASSGPCPHTSPIDRAHGAVGELDRVEEVAADHRLPPPGAVPGRRAQARIVEQRPGEQPTLEPQVLLRAAARRRTAGARCPWPGGARSRSGPSARAAPGPPRSWPGSPRRRPRPRRPRARGPRSRSGRRPARRTRRGPRGAPRGPRASGSARSSSTQSTADPPGLERLGERGHAGAAPRRSSTGRSAPPPGARRRRRPRPAGPGSWGTRAASWSPRRCHTPGREASRSRAMIRGRGRSEEPVWRRRQGWPRQQGVPG